MKLLRKDEGIVGFTQLSHLLFVLNLCMLVLAMEGCLAISVFIVKQIGAHAKFSLDYLIFFIKKLIGVQPSLHQALTYSSEVLEKGM